MANPYDYWTQSMIDKRNQTERDFYNAPDQDSKAKAAYDLALYDLALRNEGDLSNVSLNDINRASQNLFGQSAQPSPEAPTNLVATAVDKYFPAPTVRTSPTSDIQARINEAYRNGGGTYAGAAKWLQSQGGDLNSLVRQRNSMRSPQAQAKKQVIKQANQVAKQNNPVNNPQEKSVDWVPHLPAGPQIRTTFSKNVGPSIQPVNPTPSPSYDSVQESYSDSLKRLNNGGYGNYNAKW